VIGLVDEVPVIEPGELVAVKVETAAPPVAFAVNGTEAVEEVGEVAVPIVGACGTVVAVMLLDADVATEVPVELPPVTVKV
jgi:hypothetical protein